jgi:chaperonin cofactor prefoldin
MPETSFNAKHADLQDLDQQMQILAEEKERLEARLREKDSLLSDKDKDLMQYAHMVESLRRDTVDLRNELEDTQDELNRLVAAETHTDRTSNSRTSDSKA